MVFCWEDGRSIEPRRVTKWFNDWQNHEGASLGLGKVVFHSIRSTSTSYMLALSGGDIKAVQDFTGHKTAKMVTDIYGRTFLNRKQDLSQKFDEDFYGTNTELPPAKEEIPPPQTELKSEKTPEEHNREMLLGLLAKDPEMLKMLLSAVLANNA